MYLIGGFCEDFFRDWRNGWTDRFLIKRNCCLKIMSLITGVSKIDLLSQASKDTEQDLYRWLIESHYVKKFK